MSGANSEPTARGAFYVPRGYGSRMRSVQITSGRESYGQAWSLETAMRDVGQRVGPERAAALWTEEGPVRKVLAVLPRGGVVREVKFSGDAFTWWENLPKSEREVLAKNPHRGFDPDELPSLLGRAVDDLGALSRVEFEAANDRSGGLYLEEDLADFIDAVSDTGQGN